MTDLDVDEAHDESGQDHGEYGEPVASLAVGRVDVALENTDYAEFQHRQIGQIWRGLGGKGI